jgi:hypothetical protein
MVLLKAKFSKNHAIASKSSDIGALLHGGLNNVAAS